TTDRAWPGFPMNARDPNATRDSATHGYWIGVTSRDHADLARAGGFVQLNHGKAGPLERMRRGDGFAYYSPRASFPDGEIVQAFPALGCITGEDIFQADMGGGFRPFRRAATFLNASEAPIKPLLETLTFIRSKQHWGAAFRFGFLRIPAED